MAVVASQARRLVQPHGDVQILHRGAAGALAKVIQASDEHARARLLVAVDKELRAGGWLEEPFEPKMGGNAQGTNDIG